MKTWSCATLIALALVIMNASAAAAAGPLTYCGTVKSYQPASASGDGSIAIGSRTYPIAAGTAPSSALTAGSASGDRCVSGEIDAAGRFIRIDSAHPYGAVGGSGVTATICGTVADYRPPQGAQDGLLILQERGRETVVPQGTQLALAPGSSPGQRCFSGSLNSAGDAIVTGTAPVTGPGGSPQPTVASLPSTSAAQSETHMGFIALIAALVAASLVLPAILSRRP